MKKFKKRIANPMTIIAIFATLSETSAAISMPFLKDGEREVYVWFLISFPFYLLFLFFLTLNFNYRSLYAPSDFDKGKHFIKVIDQAERMDNKKQPRAAALSRILKNSITASASERAPPDASTPPKGVRHRRRNAQDPASPLHLPEPLEELNIVDARGIKTDADCNRLMESISKPSRHPTDVIVFLACIESEKVLRDGTFKYLKNRKKDAAQTSWIVYNMSSQEVTVLNKT